VALAAITIGNRSGSAYQYQTWVDMVGVTAEVVGSNDAGAVPAIYVYANPGDGLGVRLHFNGENSFATAHTPAVEYGSSNIWVNDGNGGNSGFVEVNQNDD